MITVYKFGPIGRSPDLSPFVIKVETWLRMAQLPYQTAFGTKAVMPRRKLPSIDDAGVLVDDSTTIIRHLERTRGDPLGESALGTPEQALREAFKALFENKLYWVTYHDRWDVDANFERYKPALLHYAVNAVSPVEARVVRLVAPLAFRLVRKQSRAQGRAQGLSRCSTDYITAVGVEGWRAVSEFLGDKPFMLGARPTSLDATAYGFIDSVVSAPFESEVIEFVKARANLVAYRDRLHRQFWSTG